MLLDNMPSELPDCPLEELLERYLRGDVEICKQVVKHPHYRLRVEIIARQQTVSTWLPWEDAVQEVHIHILKVMGDAPLSLGGEREFYRWLEKVAENTIRSLLRKERRKNKWHKQSLDQPLPGTNIKLKDSLADEFNLADAVEFADTVAQVVQAVTKIDQQHPKKKFLKLWQGLRQERKQGELAEELQVKQGEISKRRKELLRLIAAELGLVKLGQVKQELHAMRQGKLKQRKRSHSY